MRSEPPEQRLQRLLANTSRYAKTINVDRSFNKSRFGVQSGKLKLPAGARLTRHPGGAKAAGTTFKYSWKGAGAVSKAWSYRRSIGHLGENQGANEGAKTGFTVSDNRKDTLARGPDRVTLTFNSKGQIQVNLFDVKAWQRIAKIYSVPALTKNLSYNLKKQQASAEAAARDKTRSYGERVLFRAVSLKLVRFTTKGRSLAQAAANIRDAIADKTLKLVVSNHGGNSTGLGAKLIAAGLEFIDARKGSTPQQLKNNFVSPAMVKRFGLKPGMRILRGLSRAKPVAGPRGGAPNSAEYVVPADQTGKRLGPRLVGVRQGPKSAAGGANPQPTGARPASSGGPAPAKPAQPAGARPNPGAAAGPAGTRGGARPAGARAASPGASPAAGKTSPAASIAPRPQSGSAATGSAGRPAPAAATSTRGAVPSASAGAAVTPPVVFPNPSGPNSSGIG